jgi:hypothetical protein
MNKMTLLLFSGWSIWFFSHLIVMSSFNCPHVCSSHWPYSPPLPQYVAIFCQIIDIMSHWIFMPVCGCVVPSYILDSGSNLFGTVLIMCYASFYFHVLINQHIEHILPLTVISLAFKNCVCMCVCVCACTCVHVRMHAVNSSMHTVFGFL